MGQLDIFDAMYKDFKFDYGRPIRLFEAFAGIGTQYMALKRLGLDIEVVGISEVDKYALMSYEAIHGKVKNYGGIGSFESLPDGIDVATWSFPCQDISLAGRQEGMVEGSRSNYGYVFLDTVERTKVKPKVLLMENVRALFSVRFRDDWREIQLRLERMGYTNYAKILNAKDYGVAQNRERVFIVSILGEYNYNFPKPFKLEKRLKDYLEDEVDERYYLSDKMVKGMQTTKFNQYSLENRLKDKNDVADTIVARFEGAPQVITDKPLTLNPKIDNKQPSLQDRIYSVEGTSTAITTGFHPNIAIPEATKKGYALAKDGDGVYINRPHQKRGVVQKGMIQTLKTQPDVGVVVEDKRNLKEKLADELIESGEVINHSYASNRLNQDRRRIESDDGIVPTLTTRPDTLGYVEKKDVLRTYNYGASDNFMQGRDRFKEDVDFIGTIETKMKHGIIEPNLRIRKLTPLEVWRLMGIDDKDFYKAQKVNSNAQLYKQAGNAIVVDVLYYIFKQMIKEVIMWKDT